jgi:hypothetical protein
MVYGQVPSNSGLKAYTIRRAWSWWRLLLLRSYAQGRFGLITKKRTDLKGKRLFSPHRFVYKSIINVKSMDVISHRLYSMPINRWTVPPYCSRWLVLARASCLYFYLLSSWRYICNSILFLFFHNNENGNELITLYNCSWLSFIFHMLLFLLTYTAMMKVCPSWPSSKDHYILRGIMFRRTKGINI